VVTAGFHRIDITPPVGAPLAGFAARQGVATGVHDRLYAHALVLESRGCATAFVSLDVLGVASEFVHRVRRMINARTGLPESAIMVSATHTHSAPVTVSTFFNPGETLDQPYMERLAAAIEEAVAGAWQRRTLARVGVGSGRVSNIGRNRRTADHLPVDDEVGIVKVASPDGQTRAVLINHACHPTVLGPDNLLMTGDFPVFAIERIESALGAGSFAMFVNGAQGNISMGHSSELSAIGVITPGRTFARAEELGNRLGDAVLGALPPIPVFDDLPLAHERRTIYLPFKTYPPPSQTAAALVEAASALETLERDGARSEEVGAAKTQRLYASIRNFYAGEAAALRDGRLPTEIQGFRLGSAHFVAVPGELFVEIALRIKAETDHPLFIMGITNGYIGYLPTREAYRAGGYEVVSAKVTEAAEELLVEAIRELDRRLFSEAA
jgi:neutral/alkaline ceramidase-like enzyme